MKKNRAEKIVIVQEREWNEQEVRAKRRRIEAVFSREFFKQEQEGVCDETSPTGSGNAPPSNGKLSGK